MELCVVSVRVNRANRDNRDMRCPRMWSKGMGWTRCGVERSLKCCIEVASIPTRGTRDESSRTNQIGKGIGISFCIQHQTPPWSQLEATLTSGGSIRVCEMFQVRRPPDPDIYRCPLALATPHQPSLEYHASKHSNWAPQPIYRRYMVL